MLQEEMTGQIIKCFYRVYDGLGYGFLESVYRRSMAYELQVAGLGVAQEVAIDVFHDGQEVGHFRADLIVGEAVVIEIKASQALTPADGKQLLNYLRSTSIEVGLLLHFGPRPAFQRLVFSNARKSGLPPSR